jgi:type I restriction enzyme S subunit
MTQAKQILMDRIPENWEVIKLGDIIEYIKGKKPKTLEDKPRNGFLPYLSTEYLRNNEKPKFAIHSDDIVFVEEGELILLWDGSNAGEFFIGKRGVLSSTMVKLWPKREVDQKFLFYILKTKEKFLSAQTRGTGIPHVDKTILKNLKIFLPPLPEQKVIAQILSTVDSAIRRVRRKKNVFNVSFFR